MDLPVLVLVFLDLIAPRRVAKEKPRNNSSILRICAETNVFRSFIGFVTLGPHDWFPFERGGSTLMASNDSDACIEDALPKDLLVFVLSFVPTPVLVHEIRLVSRHWKSLVGEGGDARLRCVSLTPRSARHGPGASRSGRNYTRLQGLRAG
jgi:hypothetical protein